MMLWYVARGAGLSALVLLTISTALGALMTGRGTASNRVLAQYTHRATASLGLGVLLLHVLTILADSYAGVGWFGALVPLQSGYRPLWVGLGTLAVYTFVGVAALGFARGRLTTSARGVQIWRSLHGLAYLGWGLAMLHGINSGSDTSVTWVRMLYVGCAAAVLGSVAARVSIESKRVLTPAVAQ
jgi:predicted ferric reductase